MKLSRTSTLAALAATFLADAPSGQIVQAKQVADHLGIPTDSALKILQTLVRQGIISSQLGRSGGYQLERDPASISLLDIVEAVTGPLSGQAATVAGLQGRSTLDQLDQACEQAAEQLRDHLSSFTLADLAAAPEAALVNAA